MSGEAGQGQDVDYTDRNSNVNSSFMLRVIVCVCDYSKPIDMMTLGLTIFEHLLLAAWALIAGACVEG